MRKILNKPTEEQLRTINEAQHTQLFIIQNPGITAFVLQDADQKKYKIQLGNPHVCSCTNKNYCVHIAFLLIKKFQLNPESEMAYQTGLTDAQIDKLLSGAELNQTNVRRRAKSTSSATTTAKKIKQNEITEDMHCPICIDGFDLTTVDQLPFCRTCGNSVHTQCLYLYLQHAGATKTAQKCPYCRAPFEDGRSLAAAATERQNGVLVKKCECCRMELQNNHFVTEKFSQKKFCMFCLLNLNCGTYMIKRRMIVCKRSLTHTNAPTLRQTLVEQLMRREINMTDYCLLQQLDDPRIDARNVILRMPGYLIPECFKLSQLPPRECFLCGNKDINLFNLLSHEFLTDQLQLDFEKLKSQLQLQNEHIVTVEHLKLLQINNQQRFLSCTNHCVHELCLLICTVDKPVMYIEEQYYQAKIMPDFCSECKLPFLKDWQRESRLEEVKAQQVTKPPLQNTKTYQKSVSSGSRTRKPVERNVNADQNLLGCISISLPKILKK